MMLNPPALHPKKIEYQISYVNFLLKDIKIEVCFISCEIVILSCGKVLQLVHL